MQQSRRGRVFIALVAALLVGAAATGKEGPPAARRASVGSTQASEVSTITAWTHEAAATAAFAALAASANEFNRKQQRYKVNVLPSIHRHYNERLQSAAVTGTLPCIVEIDGPYVQAFAWRGYIRSLDEFVTTDLLNDLLDTIALQGAYHGRLYSLGQFESGLALWGNLRHLMRAGVRIPTLEAPWSLAEFERALERLTALEGVDYALNLAVYAGPGEFYSYAYAPILQGFGGDLVARTTPPAARGVLDGPQSVAAMRRFRHWFDRGWTKAVFDHADDFEKRIVALSWVGHWKYHSYRAALGRDLVALPLPDFGRGVKTGMGSFSWSITSTCHDPVGAWAFVEHLMSAPEIERMTDANGAIPARRSVMRRSALYGAHGPLRIFAEQLGAGAGVPRPATPAYIAISNAFAAAVGEIIAGRDVQAALSDAARAIDADIARNRGYPFE